MPSDRSPIRIIATLAMIASLPAALLPRPAMAASIEVTLCGRAEPIRLPLDRPPPGHDEDCALACHAAAEARRRCGPAR